MFFIRNILLSYATGQSSNKNQPRSQTHDHATLNLIKLWLVIYTGIRTYPAGCAGGCCWLRNEGAYNPVKPLSSNPGPNPSLVACPLGDVSVRSRLSFRIEARGRLSSSIGPSLQCKIGIFHWFQCTILYSTKLNTGLDWNAIRSTTHMHLYSILDYDNWLKAQENWNIYWAIWIEKIAKWQKISQFTVQSKEIQQRYL